MLREENNCEDYLTSECVLGLVRVLADSTNCSALKVISMWLNLTHVPLINHG